MSNPLHYKRPWYLINGHLESAVPYWRYPIYRLPYQRERLELADGDFLDLDWVRSGGSKLIVMSHAMEGNTRDYFIERSARYFSERGYDVLLWNFRGCGKELNRLPRLYHAGDFQDLHAVVEYGMAAGTYTQVFLFGFSMGAVTSYNYLRSEILHESVTAALLFSAPLDLKETAGKLQKGLGKVYGNAFLQKMKRRIKRKAIQHPGLFDLSHIDKVRSIEALQEQYTMKLHGFSSLQEAYSTLSLGSNPADFKVPMMLISAQNDPVLGANSYKVPHSTNLLTVFPKRGGHLGFSLIGVDHSWLELRAERFLKRF